MVSSTSTNAIARSSFTLCLTLASLGWTNAGWNPERVHHVDAIGKAHLFRGPAPVANDTFVFEALRAQLQRRALSEGGFVLPATFDLVVVSMLNTIKSSEKAELAVETSYLAGPGRRLIHWPIVGALTSPSIYPKPLCLLEARRLDSGSDHMVTKVAQLRSM